MWDVMDMIDSSNNSLLYGTKETPVMYFLVGLLSIKFIDLAVMPSTYIALGNFLIFLYVKNKVSLCRWLFYFLSEIRIETETNFSKLCNKIRLFLV